MGLATTVAIGYAGVIISLGSLLAAVFRCDALHAVGITLTAAVVCRELLEIRTELGLTRQLFRGG